MKTIKKNKYNRTITNIGNNKFDSKKEAFRYAELKQMEMDGNIENLQLQVPFILQEGFSLDGKKIRPITYIADFVYIENGEEIVEDCKGMKTDVYKIKKKMFQYKYKKNIREI